jgi:transposase
MAYLSLTYEQMQELKQTSRTAVGRVALRALMVLWRAEGLTTIQIAGLLGCERQSITCWIDRYLALGVAGLYDETRSGRPRHLDSDTVDDIEAALDDPPQDEDGSPIRWTLSRLRACFLTRACRIFGMETLRRAIHKRGFRWKRPRLWATGEDPESFEKQLLIELAKSRAAEPAVSPEQQIHFCYGDASDQHLVATLRAAWSRIGQQVRIATPPRNGHWSLFGCLNAVTGSFCWLAFAKAVSASFITFLKYLLEYYPTGQIVLVVDNASYHTSHIVVDWLKAHPRIMLLYLPARRPHLNPAEKIWAALKNEVSANRSYDNLLALGQFIYAFFDKQSPARWLTIASLQEDLCEAA